MKKHRIKVPAEWQVSFEDEWPPSHAYYFRNHILIFTETEGQTLAFYLFSRTGEELDLFIPDVDVHPYLFYIIPFSDSVRFFFIPDEHFLRPVKVIKDLYYQELIETSGAKLQFRSVPMIQLPRGYIKNEAIVVDGKLIAQVYPNKDTDEPTYTPRYLVFGKKGFYIHYWIPIGKGDYHKICLYSTGNLHDFLKGRRAVSSNPLPAWSPDGTKLLYAYGHYFVDDFNSLKTIRVQKSHGYITYLQYKWFDNDHIFFRYFHSDDPFIRNVYTRKDIHLELEVPDGRKRTYKGTTVDIDPVHKTLLFIRYDIHALEQYRVPESITEHDNW